MPDCIKLLAGLTVVDRGVGMAAALVAKYLADAGARVVRVVPECDDPFYSYYPAYRVWRCAAELNGKAANDPTMLETLLSTADAYIVGGEDYPGLRNIVDAEAITARHPKLVILEISGNPHGTRHSGRPSTDLLAQARSGLSYEQHSDRPVMMTFQPANYGAALQGLCALLAAVYERQLSGRGQIARTSLFEGALFWTSMFWAEFERPSPATNFTYPKDAQGLIFRCADGQYIHIAIAGAGSKYNTYRVLGIDDPSVKPGDSGVPHPSSGPRKFYGDVDLMAPYVARHESAPLLEALSAAGVPAVRVLAPGACWDHPQLEFNGVVVRNGDRTRHVGIPIIARSSSAGALPAMPSGDLPLTDVRVIDFGAFVAGPLASRILADLGAEVIQVESPAGDPNRPNVRGHMSANHGKLGVSLDLKSKDGIQAAMALSSNADVVSSNFRTGVSARLGIAPANLHAIRPNLIVLESPAYGSAGPLMYQAGFDVIMQAFCGHEVRTGGADAVPFWHRPFMVDCAGGMLGAIAVLSALYRRSVTGNGTVLEVPLLNAGVFLLSELIQRPDGSFAGADVVNTDRTGFRPTEAMYKALDGWIAIVARTRGQRDALFATLGISHRVARDSIKWADSEAKAVAEAVSFRAVADLTAELERAGVWVEGCRKDMELPVLIDPELQERGNVRVTDHKTYGRVRAIGSLFTLSRSRVGNARAVPELGEHTQEVLRATIK